MHDRGDHFMNIVVNGFCDSDLTREPDNRKSTGKIVVTIAGGAVAWDPKPQPIVALSMAEAE